MRLDKFLCDNNIGTRSQVKEYIKKGQVAINGQIVKSRRQRSMKIPTLSFVRGKKSIIKNMSITC